jgi:hypothetical protein
MLTAVAYKFVVAGSLPQVSYLTSLDKYILIAFLYMATQAVENFFYPTLVWQGHLDEANRFELYFVVTYFFSFILVNIIWAIQHMRMMAVRKSRHNYVYEEQEISRYLYRYHKVHPEAPPFTLSVEEMVPRILENRGIVMPDDPYQFERFRETSTRLNDHESSKDSLDGSQSARKMLTIKSLEAERRYEEHIKAFFEEKPSPSKPRRHSFQMMNKASEMVSSSLGKIHPGGKSP